jgi:hypothetical protein
LIPLLSPQARNRNSAEAENERHDAWVWGVGKPTVLRHRLCCQTDLAE